MKKIRNTKYSAGSTNKKTDPKKIQELIGSLEEANRSFSELREKIDFEIWKANKNEDEKLSEHLKVARSQIDRMLARLRLTKTNCEISALADEELALDARIKKQTSKKTDSKSARDMLDNLNEMIAKWQMMAEKWMITFTMA